MSKWLLFAIVVLLSWSGGQVAVLRRMRPVAVQCSKLATLAGRNPFEKTAVGWRNVIKGNFPVVYKELVQQDGSLRTIEDATAYEKKRLNPQQKKLLRKLQKDALEAKVAPRVNAKGHGLNVSKQVAKQLESEVQMQRGTNSERKGLKEAEAAEKRKAKQQKSLSEKFQQGAKLLTLQSDALSNMQDFLEELRKHHPAMAEALLQNDLMPAKAQLPPRLEAKKLAKTMKDASKKLRKAAAQKATPFQSNSKMFSAEVVPGLLLRGKIDAQRQTCDEGRPNIDIFEHKARQRRLFRSLKEYEKIQCLSYIDLVQRDSGSAGVRCFLVETFQGDTWQCEVKEEPDLWKDQILRVVGKRADELQDLMRVDTQPQTVREWLDSL